MKSLLVAICVTTSVLGMQDQHPGNAWYNDSDEDTQTIRKREAVWGELEVVLEEKFDYKGRILYGNYESISDTSHDFETINYIDFRSRNADRLEEIQLGIAYLSLDGKKNLLYTFASNISRNTSWEEFLGRALHRTASMSGDAALQEFRKSAPLALRTISRIQSIDDQKIFHMGEKIGAISPHARIICVLGRDILLDNSFVEARIDRVNNLKKQCEIVYTLARTEKNNQEALRRAEEIFEAKKNAAAGIFVAAVKNNLSVVDVENLYGLALAPKRQSGPTVIPESKLGTDSLPNPFAE